MLAVCNSVARSAGMTDSEWTSSSSIFHLMTDQLIATVLRIQAAVGCHVLRRRIRDISFRERPTAVLPLFSKRLLASSRRLDLQCAYGHILRWPRVEIFRFNYSISPHGYRDNTSRLPTTSFAVISPGAPNLDLLKRIHKGIRTTRGHHLRRTQTLHYTSPS